MKRRAGTVLGSAFAASADPAREILKAAGVRGVLIVHVGCGNSGAPGTPSLILDGPVDARYGNGMPRIAKVVAPEVPHHIAPRGNRRQVTFFCDDDYGEIVS